MQDPESSGSILSFLYIASFFPPALEANRYLQGGDMGFESSAADIVVFLYILISQNCFGLKSEFIDDLKTENHGLLVDTLIGKTHLIIVALRPAVFITKFRLEITEYRQIQRHRTDKEIGQGMMPLADRIIPGRLYLLPIFQISGNSCLTRKYR